MRVRLFSKRKARERRKDGKPTKNGATVGKWPSAAQMLFKIWKIFLTVSYLFKLQEM